MAGLNKFGMVEITVPHGEIYYRGRECFKGGETFWVDEVSARCYQAPPADLPGKKCFPRYCAKGPYPTESYTNQYLVPAMDVLEICVPVLEGCDAPTKVDFDMVCGGCILVGYGAPASVAAEGAPIEDGSAGDANPSIRIIGGPGCSEDEPVEKLYLHNVTDAPVLVNVSYYC